MSVLLLGLIAGLCTMLFVGSALQGDPPTTQPAITTEPASTVLSDEQKAADLCDAGLNDAIAGRFTEAIQKLNKAQKLDPENMISAHALGLLKSYTGRQAEMQAERKDEYQYEVNRVSYAFLAQDYAEALKAQPYYKEFSIQVRKNLQQFYKAIGTARGFEESTSVTAAEMKHTSIKEIDKCVAALKAGVELLKDNKSDFADEFRREAKILDKYFKDYRSIWSQVDPKTTRTRWEGAWKLRKIENDLLDKLADVETLAARKPWKIAIYHGRLAKEIAPEGIDVGKQKWYQKLLADAETRGKTAIENAKWYDALSAYYSLTELEPDNKNFDDQYTKVRRHVRVLQLYGNGDDTDTDEDADVLSADELQEDIVEKKDDSPWKEIVRGVDSKMVTSAIRKLGSSYVKSVDYRKLIRGALNSIEVLANTPQAEKSFPGLKDEKKRKAFLAAIAHELQQMKKPDRIDHRHLQMALEAVNLSSESTVEIPLSVIAVEFADGFLGELDQFSSMIWPYDVTKFYKSTMGEFTGIGVQISKGRDKYLKVVSPLLGTPAYKAGMKAGDVILKVRDTEGNDVDTREHSIDALVRLIMGPPNTFAYLTIKRRGISEPFVLEVKRKKVLIRTVNGWERGEDGQWAYILDDAHKIGYIRIKQFSDITHKTLKQALKQMKAQGVMSLVLDLRSNPGGLLRSAADVADEFTKQKRRIVSTRGRQTARRPIKSRRRGSYTEGDGDLVVLIDQNSASAAEILSGALKDWNRGLIIGQRSFGKGSVQNVIPVRNEAAFLKLTTSYYYLPNGNCLHREKNAKDWGVNPHISVFMTPKQSRRWMLIRGRTELLQEVVPDLYAADLKKQYNADLQLNTAVLVLELMKLRDEAETAKKKWVAKKS
ncbi:MAG: S41 family peptidase [Phycisphaerae bacterium]|nr:S41 family peptidase [Phycisphaerae bacterium]